MVRLPDYEPPGDWRAAGTVRFPRKLIRQIAISGGWKIADVKKATDIIFECMWESLVNEGRADLRNFGSFLVRPNRRRPGYYHIIFYPDAEFLRGVLVGMKRHKRDLALRKKRMEKAGYDPDEVDE